MSYRGAPVRPGREDERRRSRSPGRSRDRSRSPNRLIPSSTNNNDPKFLKSRVFIGHLPDRKIDRKELEVMFSKYGKILGLSILGGYGFVQYADETSALEAIRQKNGTDLKGNVLDVHLASEGRRGLPGKEGHSTPPPYERGYPPPGLPPRDRSPPRDPFREPYRDPYRETEEARYPPPTRREERDPYYDDPYKRAPPGDSYKRPLPPIPDTYYDRSPREDTYRRDPYAKERDPYYPPPIPPTKPVPADCQIIIMSTKARDYGELIERRLKSSNMITEIMFNAEEKPVTQILPDLIRKGILFAITVSPQNMAHQSLTLNILHGTPQEHRNMPQDDAMALIARSFESYLQSQREKALGPTVPRPTPFVPPGPDISYLLNLLADNRQLTMDELDKVINYLKGRRDKVAISEGRLPAAAEIVEALGANNFGGGERFKNPTTVKQQEQQQLQAKILSMLNGSTGASGLVSSATRPNPLAAQVPTSSLINFDNPSVKQAIDNLIQSEPNLLRNIASVSSVAPGYSAGPTIQAGARGGVFPSAYAAGEMTLSTQQFGKPGMPSHRY